VSNEPQQVLVLRMLKIQGQIKHLTSLAEHEMAEDVWLEKLASHRTALAAIYVAASHNHGHDTIEWHALREAALMHEFHAAANLDALKALRKNMDGAA